MTATAPPPSINAQSNDNRVGTMFVVGVALLYGVWNLFAGDFSGFRWGWAMLVALPGFLFIILAIRRLLRPGCKMILRINHGGVTDFRLGDHAVPWQNIVGVERIEGWMGLLLPAVLLRVVPHRDLPKNMTAWCKILHFSLSFLFPERLIVLCATLDVSCRDIHRVILSHHHKEH
ncbi:MAG: hypothetical protein HW380_874 [Magnetococcales bacterium]|nr:hypothetical protein [Magnetococcales bacterium]HIJ83845.1 hypothetical protein [Magnetococcales bacterium]